MKSDDSWHMNGRIWSICFLSYLAIADVMETKTVRKFDDIRWPPFSAALGEPEDRLR